MQWHKSKMEESIINVCCSGYSSDSNNNISKHTACDNWSTCNYYFKWEKYCMGKKQGYESIARELNERWKYNQID